MKYGMIGKLALLGSFGLLVSACGSTQRANPCVAWAAYNGPYVAQYTPAASADAACVANQGWEFDTIYAEIYDLGTSTEVAMMPAGILGDPNDPANPNFTADGARASGVTVGIGNFDSKEVDANDLCSIGTMGIATDFNSTNTVKFSNLVFQEDANVQGTLMKGDAEVTVAGCTAQYSFVAIAPPASCETDDDCLPVADPAHGRPFSSGIASALHTYCNTDVGLCLPADPFPSMCPAGTIEGPAGSACPVGK